MSDCNSNGRAFEDETLTVLLKDGKEVILRKAVRNDMKSVLQMFRDLAVYENQPDAVKITEETLLEDGPFESGKGYFRCIVAEHGDELIGYALYFPTYSTWEGRAMYLEDVYLKPEFRSGGCGTAIFKRVTELALKEGCSRLQWQCIDWNEPSICYYNKFAKERLDTDKDGKDESSKWINFIMYKDEMESFASKK